MSLIGHDVAVAQWRKAMASGKMHHAWLLAGRQGLGKAGFAETAASELLFGLGAIRMETENNPDIIVLSPLPANDDEEKKRAEGKPYLTKRNISVDQVRQMQRRLTTRPTLGDRRAIIIDAADDMEKGAANALLKSLEEPPQGTFFLLIAHRPGRLPATIRSRCQIVRFGDVPTAQLAEWLARAAPEAHPQDLATAASLAGGSPGAALAFLERGLGKAHAIMRKLTEQGDPDFALRGALATEIGARPDRDRIAAVIEAARMTVLAAVKDSARARQVQIIAAHDALANLAAQAPTANFDLGLLMLEIGGLLASVAMPREAA